MIPATATTGNIGYRHIERDDVPTLAGLRHAERTTSMELCRAYAELADTPLGDEFAVARARRHAHDAKARWGAALRDLDAASGIR